MLEQVAGAEVDAELAGAADHLDRQDRIAAQFEEVVAETYPLDVQHLAPDPGQLLLQHAARGLVGLPVERRVGRRQRAAVELAVGGQRQAGEQQQVGRHHVVRQLLLEMRFQRLAQRRLGVLVLLGHRAGDITGQLLAARAVERQDQRFANLRMLQQARLDLAQFDAEATDLHLVVVLWVVVVTTSAKGIGFG